MSELVGFVFRASFGVIFVNKLNCSEVMNTAPWKESMYSSSNKAGEEMDMQSILSVPNNFKVLCRLIWKYGWVMARGISVKMSARERAVSSLGTRGDLGMTGEKVLLGDPLPPYTSLTPPAEGRQRPEQAASACCEMVPQFRGTGFHLSKASMSNSQPVGCMRPTTNICGPAYITVCKKCFNKIS
uniref:Uncharacterized protein n=1 Tax=Myotis myotis TaxID=51298 RepID=A0A7J8ALR0_MYOMY|nr:hypothetical protein mMyoMyo1_007914 [Myotis myotis]